MVLPDLLRIIFGGLVFLLIVGITLARRQKNDSRARGLLAAAQIALATPLVICGVALSACIMAKRRAARNPTLAS